MERNCARKKEAKLITKPINQANVSQEVKNASLLLPITIDEVDQQKKQTFSRIPFFSCL
jgi:hypothetical protein